MKSNSETLFEAFLNQHDGDAWAAILKSLLPQIHEVDKNATQIWFYFYPVDLAQAFQKAEDPAALHQKLLIRGKYFLTDKIDSSHEFLYGHRYWPEVKKAVAEHASSAKAPASLDLASQIREVAKAVAGKVKADASLVFGITAVGFMTLQQVGFAAFQQKPGLIKLNANVIKRSPEEIIKERNKEDSQGFFGFLRTVDKVYNVTFNENDESCKFKAIHSQDLAMGSASDKRDYVSKDDRRIDGPIPVECRSAACGTCWVGVIAGGEKLAEVSSKEARRIKDFGYINTDEKRPVIRLACMTPVYGGVTIVIPPWNGVFGKYLRAKNKTIEEVQQD